MELDHIVPLHRIAPWDKIRKDQLLDPTNIQTLCRSPCHREKSREEKRRTPRKIFCQCWHAYGKDGLPVCGRAECIAEAEINREDG